MKISVYTGEGALPFPLLAKRLTAEEILFGALTGYTHFIMPGGRDRPYHAALKGAGCGEIRRFVENGGTYIGICAGAYFGAKRVAFDIGYPLEVDEERELVFFSGSAVGPAYGKGTFEYGTARGARTAQLETNFGTVHSYYDGGCAFEGDFSNVRILARYAELPGKPPAIIECPIGRGKAILSGVHLETEIEPSLNEKRLKFWTEIF